MDIVSFFAYTSFSSPLLTLGLSVFIRNASRPVRLIQYLIGIGFIVDLVCLLLGKKGINTYPIGNLFLLFQAIIIYLIYNDALKTKKYTPTIAAFYGIIFILDFFFLNGPYALNSYFHSLSAVAFILFSLLYFRNLLIELPVDFVYRMPMVWINLGILLYYSGNLFLFVLNNYFSNGMDGNQRLVWALHNMLNIGKNIFFIIAVCQSLRKTS
jgi:hypothetical protein